MEEVMVFFVLLAIILIIVKLFDEYFGKKHLPIVLGEVIAGILLATFLKLLHEELFNAGVSIIYEVFSSLGIIFLMFISGLETDVNLIKRSLKYGMSTAILGSLLPFVITFAYIIFTLGDVKLAKVYATIAIATSVGITVRVLSDLGALNTVVGTTIISAAVIDDIIGIIVLGISLGANDPYFTSIGVLTFFIFILMFYTIIAEKISTAIEKIFHSPYSYVSIAIVFVLLFSALAKTLGLAAITGAYFAGVIIGKTKERRIILENIRGMGYALFIPLFFVGIGFKLIQELFILEAESHMLLIQMLKSPVPYMFVILAILGKVIGSVLGSKSLGLSLRDSFIVGFGMVPRMEVALTVATLAVSILDLTSVEVSQIIYSTIVLVVTSSLVTPPIIQALFINKKHKKSKLKS